MSELPFEDLCTCGHILEPTQTKNLWKCVDCDREWFIDEETQPLSNFTDHKAEVRKATDELPLLDIEEQDTKPIDRTRQMINAKMLEDDDAKR